MLKKLSGQARSLRVLIRLTSCNFDKYELMEMLYGHKKSHEIFNGHKNLTGFGHPFLMLDGN